MQAAKTFRSGFRRTGAIILGGLLWLGAPLAQAQTPTPEDPANAPSPQQEERADVMALVEDSIVGIEVTDGGKVAYLQTGVVTGADTVATVALSLRGADKIEVVLRDGARLEGTIAKSISRGDRLAVLHVVGLGGTPAIAAADPVSKDDIVNLVFVGASGMQRVTGATGAYPSAIDPSAFDHLALASSRSFGGGLFNACGQLVGLSHPDPDYSRRSFRKEVAPETIGLAAPVDALTALLAGTGPNFSRATESCLSVAEVAKRRAEELEAEQAETEEAAKEAQDRLDALKKDKTATEAQLKKAEDDARRLKEKSEKARLEAEEARTESDALRQENDDLRKDLGDAEDELSDTKDQLSDTKKAVDDLQQENADKDEQIDDLWTYVWRTAIAGGVLTALVLIIGFIVSHNRGKRQKAAELEARNAAAVAEKSAAEAEYLRSLPKAVQPYSNCLLEGDNRNLSLPGELLPEEAGGVTIGRHPARAKVVLESDRISREHARFFVRDNTVFAEDLDSSNGTYVNDKRLTPHTPQKVSHGDEIRLDRFRFIFRKL